MALLFSNNHCNNNNYSIHRITLRRIISASNFRPTPGARNVRHHRKRRTNTFACTVPKKCPAWTRCNNTFRPSIVSLLYWCLPALRANPKITYAIGTQVLVCIFFGGGRGVSGGLIPQINVFSDIIAYVPHFFF